MAKAHVCIGGPLDGEHACSEDFYGYRTREGGKVVPYHKLKPGQLSREPGMYEHLRNQYLQFNTSSHGSAKSDVVWIHASLLTGSIPMSQR